MARAGVAFGVALGARAGAAAAAGARCGRARRFAVRAALAVDVVHLGRRSAKDGVYDDAVADLVRRMRGALRVDERWVKPAAAVAEVRRVAVKKPVLLLDEHGRMPRSSVDFSRLLYDRLARGGSRVTFVVGGDDGLPAELLADARDAGRCNVEAISLGPLTLTHKMARLFFIEQLYRASEIRANSKYHRE